MDHMNCANCGNEFAAHKGFANLCWHCANLADIDEEGQCKKCGIVDWSDDSIFENGICENCNMFYAQL